MKTNKLWYLGYLVGICSLLAVFTLNLNEVVRALLMFVSSISVSASYVQLTHDRLLEKDRDYKISMNDERNDDICTYASNGNYCSCLYCSRGLYTGSSFSNFCWMFSDNHAFY